MIVGYRSVAFATDFKIARSREQPETRTAAAYSNQPYRTGPHETETVRLTSHPTATDLIACTP
jgi:hypothetical protein